MTSILEVRVDGVVLDPMRYRLDEHRYLTRLPDADGSRVRWPCCQRLDLPSTEVGTFEVVYVYGAPPPTVARMAAAELACELARACKQDEKCRLTPRLLSLARQGVAIQVGSLTDALKEGKTGLPIVDLFLEAKNPNRLRMPSSVWTPDMPDRGTRLGP